MLLEDDLATRDATTLVMAPNSASSISERLDALEVSVLEPVGYLRPYPTARSTPMWMNQISPSSIGTEESVITPAVTRTIGHTYVWAASYAIAPTVGPARYPTAERSGASTSTTNNHHG